MSTTGPTKQEIEAVFSRLRSQPANKVCFDCSAKAPTWSSVTYGIFICIDCSAVHRNLGVHLTFVRSTNLDTNWTWLQLRQMQLGGNANAAQFFRQHNCNTTDAQQKYNSRAAQLYRDKLSAMAQQAMKVHGTKLHLEHDKLDVNESDKMANELNAGESEDFFAQCANGNVKDPFLENNNTETGVEQGNKFDLTAKAAVTPTATAAAAATGEKLTTTLSSGAPSVDLLNSVVSPAAVTPSIGVRKIQPKKSGLGARKGGLGATKVKTNFAEIEQRANMADQLKQAPAAVPEKSPMSAEEELESVASMRLAYQDLSVQKNKEEAKLKSIDPVKAKQMERLGMGFNLRGAADVSHSAMSDMETIQQSAAPKSSASQSGKNATSTYDSDNFFFDYSPIMYSGSGTGSTGSGSGTGTGGTSKADKQELEMLGFETIEPISSHHSNITSMFAGADGDTKSNKTSSSSSNAAASIGYDSYARKTTTSTKASSSSSSADENAAQKKFGSAKGFGSDQFFGNDQSSDAQQGSNLSRFQGSNSISSADYFGDGSTNANQRSSRGYNTGVNFQTPDLEDVKESVRQGVHKVAGRLSTLANDVMSSLQDKYGY